MFLNSFLEFQNALPASFIKNEKGKEAERFGKIFARDMADADAGFCSCCRSVVV